LSVRIREQHVGGGIALALVGRTWGAFDVYPILLAHPGFDRMTDIALSRRFFERLTCKKEMVILEGASHMSTEHPGIDQFEKAVLRLLADVAQPRTATS
jgi:pimeloyl-ACP methyl ester carboxylesterase